MTKSGEIFRSPNQMWSGMQGFDLSQMFAGGDRGLKAMVEAQQHLIDRIATMNREIADFVERRLEHDRETLQDLGSCKTPQEAMVVWGKFVETASRQYADEMGTLASLTVDQAHEAVEDVQNEIRESSRPARIVGRHG